MHIDVKVAAIDEFHFCRAFLGKMNMSVGQAGNGGAALEIDRLSATGCLQTADIDHLYSRLRLLKDDLTVAPAGYKNDLKAFPQRNREGGNQLPHVTSRKKEA